MTSLCNFLVFYLVFVKSYCASKVTIVLHVCQITHSKVEKDGVYRYGNCVYL